MTVSTAAQSPSILPPNARLPLVDTKSGMMTIPTLQLFQQIVNSINGLTPTIGCNATYANASGVDTYTLTPLDTSPAVPNLYFPTSFAFVAPHSSVAATVNIVISTSSGALPATQAFKANGATPCGSGDIQNKLFYLAYYVDSIGFVIK